MKNNKFFGFLILSFIMTSCNLFNDKEAETETSNSDTAIVAQREIQIRACTDKEIADMIKDSILAGKLRCEPKINLKKIVAFNYEDEVRQVRKFVDKYSLTTKTYIKKPGGGIAKHNQQKIENKNLDSIVFSKEEINDGQLYNLTDRKGNEILIAYPSDVYFKLANCKIPKDAKISIIILP